MLNKNDKILIDAFIGKKDREIIYEAEKFITLSRGGGKLGSLIQSIIEITFSFAFQAHRLENENNALRNKIMDYEKAGLVEYRKIKWTNS